MCNKPIRIKNKSKYLNNKSGMPYYIWVNCGKCKECVEQKQKEWNLRCYYQSIDCLKDEGNFIYFDTLTYNEENLPKLTNYIETNEDWCCFDYRDIRNFYETLRQYYKGKDRNIIYFITAEYGAIRKRPHYHIMLFIYNNITTPEEISLNVSKAWKKGRTDGIPWKSRQYIIEHNTITSINLNAIRYVAKYINKSTTFDNIINKRWNKLEKYYEKTKFDKKQIKKIKAKYFRLTTPFHRQSQHFGESALLYIDLNELIETNKLYYKDDSLKINQYCSLPTYYKRKIFQEQKEVNGKKIWIWNAQGQYYKETQESIIIEKLHNRLRDLNFKNKKYSDKELYEVANYIIKERGRLKGKISYKPQYNDAEFYNYNSDKDEIYLGKKTISKEFHGNDKIGYAQFKDETIDIEKDICIKDHLETIINDLQCETDNKSILLLKEHMNEIKKIFFQK